LLFWKANETKVIPREHLYVEPSLILVWPANSVPVERRQADLEGAWGAGRENVVLSRSWIFRRGGLLLLADGLLWAEGGSRQGYGGLGVGECLSQSSGSRIQPGLILE